MTDRLPRLVSIEAVTHVVADLDLCEHAYGEYLGYRPVERRTVTAAESASWGTPAMDGRRLVELEPESGEPCRLRFIESAEATGYRALTSHGWTATEIVVQNVDALAARLAGSPFQVIAGPKGLTRFPMIRAMQALGPAGECLYFTEVGEGSGLVLAPALSFVGRVFIVVAGGADVDAMFEPYAQFCNTIDPPVASPVGVISWANDLPPDTLHPHGLVKLDGGTMIELDGYPACTRPRGSAPGELPPGMAMVRFGANALPGASAPTLLLRGAGGELIELVRTASDSAANPTAHEEAADAD